MASKEKKAAATTAEQLQALDDALREKGHSIADLLVHVAKQSFGVDLTRVLHPVEEPKG